MSDYKTIIFDLSEVLIYGLLYVEKELIRDYGIPSESLFKAFGGENMLAYFCGRIGEDEYIRRVIETNGWTIEPSEIKKVVRRNFIVRLPGMQPVLEALKPHYELVLLSDHGREWVDYILKVHTFLDIFDKKYFSFDLDGLKRYPDIFLALLDRLGRRPQECLFIDDLERNCKVASSVGIDNIRFTSAEDLIPALHAQGVEIKL